MNPLVYELSISCHTAIYFSYFYSFLLIYDPQLFIIPHQMTWRHHPPRRKMSAVAKLKRGHCRVIEEGNVALTAVIVEALTNFQNCHARLRVKQATTVGGSKNHNWRYTRLAPILAALCDFIQRIRAGYQWSGLIFARRFELHYADGYFFVITTEMYVTCFYVYVFILCYFSASLLVLYAVFSSRFMLNCYLFVIIYIGICPYMCVCLA